MNSERLLFYKNSNFPQKRERFEQQLAFAAAKVDLKGSTADPLLVSDDDSVFAGSDQHSVPGSFRSREGSGLHTFWDYPESFHLYRVFNDPGLQPSLFLYDVLNLLKMKEIWRLYFVFFPLIFSFQSQHGSDSSSPTQIVPADLFLHSIRSSAPSQEANKAGRWAVPSRHRASVRKCWDGSNVGTKQTGFSHFKAKCDISSSPSASGLNSSSMLTWFPLPSLHFPPWSVCTVYVQVEL